VATRAEWLRRPLGSHPQLERIDRAAGAAVVDASLAIGDDRWLEADEARRLLEAYGLPVVPERVAGDAEAVRAAAAELGYPVVVKSAAAGAHKTETGGVALDLDGETAAVAAAGRIGYPVLVQPMLTSGTELLAGLVQDPVFGPLVAFGPGGTFAELIGDANLRLAPLTDVDARELVTEGKAGRLVRGFRNAPAADEDALVDLVHRLGALGDDHPAVTEVDLNPVLAFPDGCVAVDARVRVRRPDLQRREKSW
jgi:acyl-CoA synthetase (NDP forming)